MASFRLGHDEVEFELPWRLMQNGPVTLYRRREYFEDDIAELQSREFEIRRFDCLTWDSESAMHDDLRSGLGLPDYTGKNFDALDDSLADIEVPEHSGVMVALDNFSGSRSNEILLQVLANASRWWLLFGRIFGVLVRTDDAPYDGPVIGAMQCQWNGREWSSGDRGL